MTRDELSDEVQQIVSREYLLPFSAVTEFHRGGDFTVYIEQGQTDEGAPRVVHAVYDDLDAVADWFYQLEAAAEDTEDMEALVELAQQEYERRIAAGFGNWHRGDTIVSRMAA